ncbi:hypothetical protein FNV43_RR02533 [Rhamnella rubrinervis]|uniref:HMG box domain-containing protein n=1 Tax=Rhamnella rubrinervis TaxID=2594499 RepID=A0A8K0HTQ4_9ROSA|nr:hypothetical protein FNV43_RR02533 [Rhamnella rubrinervis]
MGGGSLKSNPTKARKRVEATEEPTGGGGTSLVRAKDGSAFTRCEECSKDVPVALISFHSCSLEAKIKMNLEAQVVERLTEAKKPTERKKSTSKEPNAKRAKKSSKNSDKPKRPPTAFFIFMDDFRKTYKEENHDSMAAKSVAKEAGAKWKSMTDEEKKPYTDKAAELKAEYDKALESDSAEDGEGEEGSEKEAENKEVEEKEVENKEEEDVSDGE